VTGHPDAACSNDIILVFEFGGELVNTLSEEEIVMLFVKASLAHSIQEVRGDVQRFQVLIASILQGLSDDASARADIEHDSATVELKAPIGVALRALVDDVLGLGEVYNARPLVVSFRRETSVPVGDVLLRGQVGIELVDDESAFVGLSLRCMSLL